MQQAHDPPIELRFVIFVEAAIGKVLRVVAVVAVSAAIAYFAPSLAPALLKAVGVTATSAALSAATAVITATGAIAAGAIAAALSPRPSAIASAPGIFRQSVSNSFIIYGKRRAGGLLIFFHPRGKEFRYFVIAVAGHRCKGVTRWFLGDEQVAVDANGKVLTGRYANNAWLWFARGTDDQTAHPTFVAETNGKWSAEHRGRGTALIYAKFKLTDDTVQAGMPNITAEVEGKDDILDPRTNVRGYTRNAVLIFYDWLAMAREVGGFGAYDDEIDWDWVSAQANVCDEIVQTPAGPEARYEFDSYIQTGAAPSEVRDTFMICCAGSFTYSGGKMLLRPGYYVPPSATLHEDDLAGPITVPALLPGDRTATEVAGTYVEPNLYQAGDIPTRARVAEDVRQLNFDLPHVTSIYRGQRILEIFLRKAEAERRVTWPMNIAGIAVATLDTVQLGTARYGLSNYAFQVANWGLNQDFSVGLQLEETGPEIFEFDPASYLEPGDSGELAVADPISDTPTRAAHQILAGTQSVAYPVTPSAGTITIVSFSATIDTGERIDFPAATLSGLADATEYVVLWSMSGGAYSALVRSSAASIAAHADPDMVVIRYTTTPAADGTYPTSPTPPEGDGGTGYGGGGGIPGAVIP